MSSLKEYRICMPLSVKEYSVGQLYMIAKHSHMESNKGEGITVVSLEDITSPEHGEGRFAEKRLYMGNRMSSWVTKLLPKNSICVKEKSWNFFPYTKTEYICSFIPKLLITVQTTYADDNGSQDNIFNLSPADLERRRVEHLDIGYDELEPRRYRREEDLRLITSRNQRLPLKPDWKETSQPLMCSYKLVEVSFPVWGLQTRVEGYLQDEMIRHLLIHAHRQAAAWMDEWLDMTLDDVKAYEQDMLYKTNAKVGED